MQKYYNLYNLKNSYLIYKVIQFKSIFLKENYINNLFG